MARQWEGCQPYGRTLLLRHQDGPAKARLQSFLVFPVFGQFESTKLSSIRKVLDEKVRNFSPTKISSFTVFCTALYKVPAFLQIQ